MKILITGSSGYIGSHLTNLLMQEHEVHGLDIVGPKIEPHKFFDIDIRQPFALIDEYDAVVHLAALMQVGESVRIPTAYYDTNVGGTINAIRGIDTNNFIFASTGAAARIGSCSSPYALSKRIGEDMVGENIKRKGFTIFRFYNVVGQTVVPPTNPDGLMYNLLKSLNTKEFTIFGSDYNTKDGTCIRDYVHVEEICRAIEGAIINPSNRIESLGHGVGYSVKEIVHTFQKVNNVKVNVTYSPRRSGDLESNVLDNVSTYMKKIYGIEELLKVNI